ncbi:PA0069 family radical SAM protein [Boseongicola aestuarii]|uniref:Radical SAM superfamily protein n=1 Tax=Boseongicola aestuarii TaxID=1470561 RepID=A0A238IWF2_9RHOB|nr:PA0069 family radical SAM protein [Boseongicola aestuarii]SMX22070.1 Radical SAM superfamily protein [Boseongicola aestuarii]
MPRNAHTPDPDARGRAALSNRVSRFERLDRDRVDDGWDIDEDLPTVRTDVSLEIPRKIITRNTSPDVPFDRSINPYRGCEHGCIYCFARPTHAYLGLSPGLDFETRLIARPDAPDLLARELRAKSYNVAVMAIGTNTDPYQPIEKEQQIMRRCLEVLRDFNHPVGIVTKGTLIERDIDILSEMASRNLVRVGISVTTLDAQVSRAMEPRVPSPKRRLETIRRLADAGIPVRIQCAPIIPGLTDHELESLLEAGSEAGAYAANWVMLRLPLEVAPLFKEWLQAAFPNKAAKVMARVREAHDGREYDAEWGKRMRGTGTYAELIAHRFALACRRLGLFGDVAPLRTDLFRPPPQAGDQLSLF